MPTHADENDLLSIATSIARGDDVDWDEANRTTSDRTLVGELRVIDRVARLGDRIPDRWGRLAIAGELGRGSHGTVYRAHDPHLGVEVALKVVRPEGPGGSAIVARALNEARMLAQINHPNVVRVFWAEPLGGEVGVAMELVNGQTLRDIVRQRFPLPVREVLTIGRDLCRALAAVHGQRMLHGDIKAGNVMRTPDGRTVLMDFGVGQDLKIDAGPAGLRAAGTPLYLAPELFAGRPRTPQSDIYSAGVLLYHLATDAYPLDAHDAIGVERHHAERRPLRPIRELRADLPSAFVKVVERAMARRPEDRYQTAVALGDALDQALTGRRLAPIWRVGLPLATAAVMVFTAYLGWPRPTTPLPPEQPIAAAPIAAPAADSYRIDAAFYRLEGKTDVRLTPGARVSKDDELSLRIQSSVPVYAYVVNEDDRGESYLLFPLPDQQLSNPLPANTRHEIPGIVDGEQVRWRVSSAGGREHFLIFVTPEQPLPGFERMFASLPRPVFGEPVIARALPNDVVGELRGVGGLTKAPPAAAAPGRLAEAFAVPLPDREETARGVWVRQLTLENPGR
jgi:serine/threonine protein kinase